MSASDADELLNISAIGSGQNRGNEKAAKVRASCKGGRGNLFMQPRLEMNAHLCTLC